MRPGYKSTGWDQHWPVLTNAKTAYYAISLVRLSLCVYES